MSMDPLLRELCLCHPDQMPKDLLSHLVTGRPLAADAPPVRVYVELVEKKPRVRNPEGVISAKYRLRQILDAVCAYYSVSRVEMASARKPMRLVRPRQIFMYLARELTTRSMPEIARFLGGRDHTTILHGARKIESLMRLSQDMAMDVSDILRILGAEDS